MVWFCFNPKHPEPIHMVLVGAWYRCPVCGASEPDAEITRRALRGRKPHRLPETVEVPSEDPSLDPPGYSSVLGCSYP